MLQAGRLWVRFLVEPLDFPVDLILPATLRAVAGSTVIRRIFSLSTSFVTGRRKAWNILENASDALHREQGFKFTLSENKFLMWVQEMHA
jgi:hypothetical protein